MSFRLFFFSVNIASNEAFLKNGQGPQLTVMSAGHALHVFVNGEYSGTYMYNYLHNICKSDFVLSWIIFYVLSWFLTGTVYGGLDNPKLTYSQNVKLRPGSNKISLLSASVGLPVSFFCSLILLRLFG